MKLIFNAIQCNVCEEVIVSYHRHDFKSCQCGKVSVDGGLDYRRRLGSNFTECCAYMWDPTHSRPEDAEGKWMIWNPGGTTNTIVIFDRQEEAKASAKEMSGRLPLSAWYTAKLTHVPTIC